MNPIKAILSLIQRKPAVYTKRDKPELSEDAIKVRAALRCKKPETQAYVNVHMALKAGE